MAAKTAQEKMMDRDPQTLDLFGNIIDPTPARNTVKNPVKQATPPAAEKPVVEKPIIQKAEVGVKPQAKTVSETVSESPTRFEDLEPVKKALVKKEPRSSRRKGPEKSDNAFKTISEVASSIGVPQHVLRFWETKFSQIKPMKRGGGRRYYRPDDVTFIERIHHLLYSEGYTIKGVQRLIKTTTKAEFLAGEAGLGPRVVEKVVEKLVEKPVERVVEKIVEKTVTAPKQNDKATDDAMVAILQGLRAIREELNAG